MTWRFAATRSDSPPSGVAPAGRLLFHERLGRWRWAFQPTIARARELLGGVISSDQAAAAVSDELRRAVAYVHAQLPDSTVFGTVYDESTRAVAAAASLGRAESSKQNAAKAAAQETEDVPEYQRGGYADGAAEILYDLLAVDNPNDLVAACRLVRYLHLAERPDEAVAEWCDVYCRAASLSDVLQRAAANAPELKLAEDAYDAVVKAGLAAELDAATTAISANHLVDPQVMQNLIVPDSAIMDFAKYVRVMRANWVDMVSTDESYQRYFQATAGTIAGMRASVGTLIQLWQATGVRGWPRALADQLTFCVEVYEGVIVRLKTSAIRAEAAAALGDIPLPAALAALKRHAADPDAATHQAVATSISRVEAALAK